MLILERMLPNLFAQNHKVLIFSQMRKMLDILADYLDSKNWKYCRIDGQTKMQERTSEMQTFKESPDIRAFLLSTRSGGLGLNLTSADTVIIYDSDWNPQMDLQAQDRVHRIGQTKPVHVYRFVTANSVEQTILEKARNKRKLERVVIHKGQFKGHSKYYAAKDTRISIEELIALVKEQDTSGVQYGLNDRLVNGEKETLGSVLGECDMDALLDRTKSYDKGSGFYLVNQETVL
jgi:ATP-dependent DNA helicase